MRSAVNKQTMLALGERPRPISRLHGFQHELLWLPGAGRTWQTVDEEKEKEKERE